MRRNLDLVRAILLEVEKNDEPYAVFTPTFEGWTEIEVSYHVELLEQAGLITARDRSAIGLYIWAAGHLTWAGHEFLDCIRDETLWKGARESVSAASGGGESIDALRAVLVERIRERAAAGEGR